MEYVISFREQENCVNLIPDIYNHTVLRFFSGHKILVLFQVLVCGVWHLHGMQKYDLVELVPL